MTPWPADVQQSYAMASPTTSPMQQTENKDPFAAYAAGPGVPPLNNAPNPAAQQPQNGNIDPWAAMAAAPPAQQMNTMAPPAQMQPAPTMPQQQVQAMPPMAPPAAPPVQQQQVVEQKTPPPAVVEFADTGNRTPPSPLGDVSVLAAANAAHAAQAAAVAPNMPYAMQNGGGQPSLQPMAQPMHPITEGASQNPFDMGAVATSMPAAPPPAAMPPQAPPTPPNQADATTGPVPQQPTQNGLAPPQFAPTQQFADPFGYAFSPVTSPITSPVTSPQGSPGNGAVVPSQSPNADPYGVFGGQQQPPASGQPPSIPTMPNATAQAVVPSAAPNADPFGVFGGQQQPPAAAPAANADPFGGGALVTSGGLFTPTQAPQPAPAASGGAVEDPFGIFGAPTQAPAPAQQAAAPTTTPAKEEDPWAAAGFNDMVSEQPKQSSPDPRLEHVHSSGTADTDKPDEKPITLDSNNLPSEGEYYEARINARSLGAMFYTSRNLEETLFYKIPQNVIEALGSRPVVAYVAENSAAYNSGVTLGHVILSVNGHEVDNPEYCANVIKTSPRPMNLRCYIPPELHLTLNEGKHSVKYDTKDLEAPLSVSEWKEKYVVVGGIVTKPYMINMFYNKRDYDRAVKEAHSGHKISVKVKQFDLRGARIILKGKDGKPNWIDYPSERKPWYYITILPNKGYPIKIAAGSLDKLEPVYAAVRRCVRKDMENRYHYRMESSGFGGEKGGDRNGFEGFGDANVNDSYWR